jgi:hypothetical protein
MLGFYLIQGEGAKGGECKEVVVASLHDLNVHRMVPALLNLILFIS